MTPTIPLTRPYIAGHEAALVADAVWSHHWAGDGEMTQRATELVKRATGARAALLTTSCTHALELSALLLDLAPGDEVIVPAFTFPTTASAFALRGAKIVFVDVRPDTLCLDERALPAAVTARTRAIVPVHYAGVACAIDAITAIAKAANATVIEDNAHGLYGTYRGAPLGSLGRMATLSFHQSKNISCGEGGALLLNDAALVERAEILREKGTNRARFFRGEVDKYTWVDVGSSYLLADLLAAVLVAQLEAADTIQRARQRVWATYSRELAGWAERNGVGMPGVPAECEHPAHLFYLVLPDLARRTAMLAHLHARGIGATFHYQPLHLSELGRRWGGKPGDLPVTERIADSLIRLPLYPDLAEAEQARVIGAVNSFVV